ncbi:MAG: hypothetical protein AAB922_04750 [Patescibacteria group bacterium]
MCIFCSDDEMAETRHGIKRNPRGEDEAYEKAREEGRMDNELKKEVGHG